ncbi:SIS domain-containing protein [Deinococcus radiophilus]|uniref:SIS domain-containing protein n=1 Tax=Deinococcus radiophilus TaxID=32062 RepID=A0A431VSP7_9DEIO|nr:SIS domain-containing protein [Deinococcus radiophilus]RTR26133.1 SIS domain-containing protein [Deinococcus radiophilus]UFA51613.1 SIS domain-containing protein [Deinococcus radiophilus]
MTESRKSEPLMLQETREIPAVLRRQRGQNAAVTRALAERLRGKLPPYAITVARGSSDHACTVLKYALEVGLGLPVGSMGPSVQTLYGRELRLDGALVIAVSQSGASPDVVETVQAARRSGAVTVALVNVEGSELAGAAEWVLPMQAGPEKAVAATKSYLASLHAPLPLLAELTGDAELRSALDRLPEVCEETLALEDQARELAERYRFAESLMVLSRGLNFGVGREAALKLKETSGLHAEAYSAAEFSHGPKRLIAEGVPLLGLTSRDAAAEATAQAYAELQGAGADLKTLGPAQGSDLRVPGTGHPFTDPLPTALAFYLFAAHLALQRGEDPDRPPLLSKVTQTR